MPLCPASDSPYRSRVSMYESLTDKRRLIDRRPLRHANRPGLFRASCRWAERQRNLRFARYTAARCCRLLGGRNFSRERERGSLLRPSVSAYTRAFFPRGLIRRTAGLDGKLGMRSSGRRRSKEWARSANTRRTSKDSRASSSRRSFLSFLLSRAHAPSSPNIYAKRMAPHKGGRAKISPACCCA